MIVRLIVASTDRSRILARPTGLAGWRLPAVAVDDRREGSESWTDADLARVASVAGGPVAPVAPIGEDAWEFRPIDRITAAGTTWIPVVDVGRLGSDAAVVRAWAEQPDRHS